MPQITAQFFGGTSLLIIVGVMLRYDAPGRNASDSAPLRRVLAQRANSRAGFRSRAAYSRGEAAERRHVDVAIRRRSSILVIAGVAIFLYGR